MSDHAAAPAAPAAQPKKRGLFKMVLAGGLGIGSGIIATYTTAVVDRIAKPPLPVANFSVSADGLTATCQNRASGETGWWDFGDGSPLEPFEPEEATATHIYAKPGNYAVKLTVRNFVAQENDRSVAVEVAAVGKDAPQPPQVNGFEVKAVSPTSIAPATFRVTADVQHADYCVWDLGDGRVDVLQGGGKIDRLVTFDKAGAFPIQVVAHNGALAAKQVGQARVDPTPDGTLTAVLTVIDGGAKVDRTTRTETVAVAAPKDKSASFAKTVAPRPGSVFTEAVLVKPETPGVKNLKLALAADRKTAALTGEWTDPKNAKADAIVPVRLTEERATHRPAAVTHLTGVLPLTPTGKAAAVIPLPALPKNSDVTSRAINVEVRQAGPNGKSYLIASGPLVGRGPSAIPAKQVYSPPAAAVTTASYDIEAVKVTFEVTSSGVVPARGP